MSYGGKRSWDSEKEMCGDFKRGNCSRGDRCRFSHGDSGGGGSRGDDRGGYGKSSWGGGGDSKRGRTEGKYDKKPCGDFQKGNCSRGDRCRFSHEDLKQTLDDDLDAYFGKEKKKSTEGDKLDDKLNNYFGKDAKSSASVKCAHPDCTLAVHSDKSVSTTFCCKACQAAGEKEPKEAPNHGKKCERVTYKADEEKKENAVEKKSETKKVEEPKGDESE